MSESNFDVQAGMQQATTLIQKTAEELRQQLVEMAAQLDPFPYFLGSTEVRAIEAEPGGVQKADRGCVVLCQDGELYEFTMTMTGGSDMDFGIGRDDSVKRIEMPHEDYIPYAYNGLKELAQLLEEQRARASKYRF